MKLRQQIPPDLSIIVPTYREAANLRPLTELVADALTKANLTWELIFANDEGGDDTVARCAELAQQYPVRLLNRTTNRGLALAVLDAARLARGRIIAVMDADMSHPPAALAEMTRLLDGHEADLVIGSRRVSGARTDEHWAIHRHLASAIATVLTRGLTSVRDPMTGYFAMRRKNWPDPAGLDPIGFKICLDIIVRQAIPNKRIHEIPIFFADRKFGHSKLDSQEALNYLHHLSRLYRFKLPHLATLTLFALVGCCGLVVDISGYFLAQAAGVNHIVARALSFWPATFCNWFLNRIITFADRRRRRSLPQAAAYAILTLVAFAINWGTYTLLVTRLPLFAEHRLLALGIGVLAGLAVNFIGADRIIFAAARTKAKTSTTT